MQRGRRRLLRAIKSKTNSAHARLSKRSRIGITDRGAKKKKKKTHAKVLIADSRYIRRVSNGSDWDGGSILRVFQFMQIRDMPRRQDFGDRRFFLTFSLNLTLLSLVCVVSGWLRVYVVIGFGERYKDEGCTVDRHIFKSGLCNLSKPGEIYRAYVYMCVY